MISVSRHRWRLAVAAGVLAVLGACESDPEGPAAGPERLFPDDYAATYTQVRTCRKSGDHELNFVRILADPTALGVYQERSGPFPKGSVILKEEYIDPQCSGELIQYTVMRREAEGYDPAHGDWRWQKVSAAGEVQLDGKLESCAGCHAGCGVPPTGWDGTCAEP